MALCQPLHGLGLPLLVCCRIVLLAQQQQGRGGGLAHLRQALRPASLAVGGVCLRLLLHELWVGTARAGGGRCHAGAATAQQARQ